MNLNKVFGSVVVAGVGAARMAVQPEAKAFGCRRLGTLVISEQTLEANGPLATDANAG